MSYDALVWLLVGLGIGVAASLMLLIGYSMLEYGRLSRRFRKARAATVAAAAPAVAPVPVAPRTSLLARPAPKPETKPVADAATETTPLIEPKPIVEEKPARPALVVVAAPESKPAVIAKPAPPAPAVEQKPVAASPTEAVAAPVPKRPQSVEAMFAEAFANDRLTVSPEPDEAAASKPGVETPPK